MEFELREYNKLEFVGDLHGGLRNFVYSIEDKHDTLFFLTGDNNIGKQEYEKDVEDIVSLEYSIAKNNNYIIIIRGNHDNPKYFKAKSSFRNELKEDARHFIFVPDYSIVYTQEHTILCVGGARSIDRYYRIKNYNYWMDENIKKPDDNFFDKILEKKIDIIFSHAAPLFAHPLEFSNELKHYNSYIMNSYSLLDKTAKNDVYKERLLLKGIYEKLNIKNHIKYLIYGHYHKSLEMTYNKTKCISLGLKEIKSL